MSKRDALYCSSRSTCFSQAPALSRPVLMSRSMLWASWRARMAARDLTIALPSNVNTLDPDKSTTVGTDLSVVAHIYTPLVDRGPDLKLRPGLATSWTAVSDTVWR